MNPFSFVTPVGLLGPALAAGAFAYAWRGLLQRPWWFVSIGGIASYVLMALCITWALSGIGFSGNLAATHKQAIDPVAVRYLSFMLVWLAGSAGILFVTRYLLAKV